MSSYTTIKGTVETELEIQRSRFLTRLQRVETEQQAREVIAEVRATHPRARHHCTAFVLGSDGRIARHNDDGEPSGTAGAPMLEALTAAQLSDVVAIVTRYFGGILLGAGGLTRAYRAAVAAAASSAPRIRRELQQQVAVTSSYEVHGALVSELRRRGAIIGEAVFSEVVTQTVSVPLAETATVTELAATLSAGAAHCEILGQQYVDLPAAF